MSGVDTGMSRAVRAYPVFIAKGRGACGDADPDLFTGYGDRGQNRRKREAVAKAVCAGCPFRLECRRWATDTLQQGIWGGTDETERAMARHHGGFLDERLAAARRAA